MVFNLHYHYREPLQIFLVFVITNDEVRSVVRLSGDRQGLVIKKCCAIIGHACDRIELCLRVWSDFLVIDKVL